MTVALVIVAWMAAIWVGATVAGWLRIRGTGGCCSVRTCTSGGWSGGCECRSACRSDESGSVNQTDANGEGVSRAKYPRVLGPFCCPDVSATTWTRRGLLLGSGPLRHARGRSNKGTPSATGPPPVDRGTPASRGHADDTAPHAQGMSLQEQVLRSLAIGSRSVGEPRGSRWHRLLEMRPAHQPRRPDRWRP